jgi:hypothetical protein
LKEIVKPFFNEKLSVNEIHISCWSLAWLGVPSQQPLSFAAFSFVNAIRLSFVATGFFAHCADFDVDAARAVATADDVAIVWEP